MGYTHISHILHIFVILLPCISLKTPPPRPQDLMIKLRNSKANFSWLPRTAIAA